MVFKYLGISQMLWMGAKKLWEDLTYFAQYPLSILPENIIKTEVFSGVEARSGWILWMGASSSWRCSIKKLSVKISQYSQEKMCWSLLLTKLQAWRACYFINKRGQHRCFLCSCEYCKIFKYSYFWMGSKSFSLHYKVKWTTDFYFLEKFSGCAWGVSWGFIDVWPRSKFDSS